jgi:hypothetical protein
MKNDYGCAFVNSAQGTGSRATWTNTSSDTYYIGSAPAGISGASNKNTNMYIIETSVLPKEGNLSDYVLGDPRAANVFNLNGAKTSFTENSTEASWSVTAKQWSGNDRKLLYYYPVGRDASYNTFIAPRIRIASSFGATQPMTYFDAFRRCASYQEDGYPAGRWRVPTKAEIEYIARLNSDGKIPLLLGSDSGSTPYWCNSGYMTVEKGKTPSYTQSTTNTNRYGQTVSTYVRCVYDDWYWGESDRVRLSDASVSSLNTFTWGDQTRESVNLAQ